MTQISSPPTNESTNQPTVAATFHPITTRHSHQFSKHYWAFVIPEQSGRYCTSPTSRLRVSSICPLQALGTLDAGIVPFLNLWAEGRLSAGFHPSGRYPYDNGKPYPSLQERPHTAHWISSSAVTGNWNVREFYRALWRAPVRLERSCVERCGRARTHAVGANVADTSNSGRPEFEEAGHAVHTLLFLTVRSRNSFTCRPSAS